MLPLKNRLPREEFRKRGYWMVSTPYFSIKTKNNSLSANRLGVVVGVSVDKRATQRNFWERQTKAEFMKAPNFKKDFIITIFARVKNLSKEQFIGELQKALKRVKKFLFKMFTYLYHLIFKYPILNLLIYFYQTIAFRDLGLAIIFVTIFIRLILYPFFHTGAKQQMLMQRIQPHVKKIQEEHKDNREKQAQALMALYKEHGVNPFSSILLLIIQLPILLALYRIILYELVGTAAIVGLYSFVHAPTSINVMFLGIFNLQQRNFWFVIAAAAAQFFQARLAIWRNPNGQAVLAAEKMARQMAYVAPVVTLVIFYSLPIAVDLYWITSSVFSILQQAVVNKHLRAKFGN